MNKKILMMFVGLMLVGVVFAASHVTRQDLTYEATILSIDDNALGKLVIFQLEGSMGTGRDKVIYYDQTQRMIFPSEITDPQIEDRIILFAQDFKAQSKDPEDIRSRTSSSIGKDLDESRTISGNPFGQTSR